MNRVEIRINLDPKTFDDLFEANLPVAKSPVKAYERTEDEAEMITGHRQYNDYDSYRNARRQRKKRRR